MSDINAALGRAQLSRFRYLSEKRKKLCRIYDKKFYKHPLIKIFKRDFINEVPHIYTIQILNLKKREELRNKLQEFGIQTGIHYYPGYKFSKFKKNKSLFPNTEKVYKELITLPLHPDISKKDIEFIFKKINTSLKSQFFK